MRLLTARGIQAAGTVRLRQVYHTNELRAVQLRSRGQITWFSWNEMLALRCNDRKKKLLVNPLVTSHLDHCNSILYGLLTQELEKLEAHLVTRTKPYDHIKPALGKLHQLPVESCTIFKVILITFKILCALSPT